MEINPKSGALKAWSILNVVDSVSDPAVEIHIEKARQLSPAAEIGGVIEREVDPAYLGRIAAQTARQAIMQRIRQFEKDRIYDDFKDTVGDIVTGTVRRRERGDLIIDLGKAEAVLPPRERVPGEDYSPGESIRCLLLKIEQTNRAGYYSVPLEHQFRPPSLRARSDRDADGTVSIKPWLVRRVTLEIAVHNADQGRSCGRMRGCPWCA